MKASRRFSQKKMNKRRTSKSRGGMKSKSKSKLPTNPAAAVKRAKQAIRASILDPSDDNKKGQARIEIENANSVTAGTNRKNWQREILLVPHYELCTSSWYCETDEIQWELEEMPVWARNELDEPDIGIALQYRFRGRPQNYAYTKAPASVSR
jgi:hypothetical protein